MLTKVKKLLSILFSRILNFLTPYKDEQEILGIIIYETEKAIGFLETLTLSNEDIQAVRYCLKKEVIDGILEYEQVTRLRNNIYNRYRSADFENLSYNLLPSLVLLTKEEYKNASSLFASCKRRYLDTQELYLNTKISEAIATEYSKLEQTYPHLKKQSALNPLNTPKIGEA